MKRVQKDACHWGGHKVSQEGIPFEYVVAEVKVELHIVPEDLVEENVCTAHTVALVEAEYTLAVETLDALHVIAVNGRPVRFIEAY